MLYSAFGVSNWYESIGEEFDIFIETEFPTENEAVEFARKLYRNDLEIVLRWVENGKSKEKSFGD